MKNLKKFKVIDAASMPLEISQIEEWKFDEAMKCDHDAGAGAVYTHTIFIKAQITILTRRSYLLHGKCGQNIQRDDSQQKIKRKVRFVPVINMTNCSKGFWCMWVRAFYTPRVLEGAGGWWAEDNEWGAGRQGAWVHSVDPDLPEIFLS